MTFDFRRSISLCRVSPTIVPTGKESKITIEPMGVSKRFDDATEYTVTFIPMEIYDIDRCHGEDEWDSIRVNPQNGKICVSYCFEHEQEWVIHVISDAERERGPKARPVIVHIYSLEPDLYERNPYVGDLHVHSARSDGKEDPAVVAANYRKNGFDFFALTDHHKWAPSEEVIKTYADLPLGFKMFHGEEVHAPKATYRLHVVNFGSQTSVNELYLNNVEEIDAQVEEEAKHLNTPKGVNALEYAWRKWVYDEIKKSGGLCIVAHPNWVYKYTYNMSSAMLDYVFETGLYDAFELLGGVDSQGANLQTAFYQEQRAQGRRIPIVASSDSHSTDPAASHHFGARKTIVFAKDCELESVRDAILDMYSVAVEIQDVEHIEHVYGSYRLVKYARFLLERYFPTHDELCVEEGILMREYALGDADAGDRLKEMADRTQRKMNKLLRG